VRPKIRNRDVLLARGERQHRQLVLDIVEEALAVVDGGTRIQSIMSLKDDTLHIGSRSWDLSHKRNVYLIGAGKACNAMAMAVDSILGERLTRGIAIVKIAEDTDEFGRTEVHVGGHPLPNQAGHLAALKVLELVDGLGPDDLVIAVMSGGSSALMNVPVEGISVEDEAAATEVLLTCGAGIYAINAIRRHISQTNGGRLAQRIEATGATLIGINICDAVSPAPTADISEPDQLFEGTPIGADRTTIGDARATIRNYDLAERLPSSVVQFIDQATDEHETPKNFADNTYFTVASLTDLAAAAAEAARGRGLNTHVLTTYLEGESRDVGTFMAALAREIRTTGRPFAAPCVVISAGETTTRILPGSNIAGHGGPSQELVLSYALGGALVPGACMFSMDSEGTDGSAPAAGGLTDSSTVARAREAGVDIYEHLRDHAAFEALSAIGDAVVTGNTGTNLCDLNILYVPAADAS
jgi:glycerate-2-kinase